METERIETGHQLAMAAKCAHAGCTCTVESGGRYCSDYCLVQAERTDAAHAEAEDDACRCGHCECEDAAQPVAVSLMPGAVTTG